MQKHRQELLRSATRRIRRGKKTTGRIVASALGFGMAYAFDTENGQRRKRLQHVARCAFHQINGALAPDIAHPPVFPPAALRVHPGSRPLVEGVRAAR
jgi:hypothetical protein